MAKSTSSPNQPKTGDNRLRNWACVLYPDSAAENWLSIIADSKIPTYVSPIHDRDVNPNGEPKKPHYHVLTPYEGKKSEAQARAFFESFGGVGCERVNSLRGYARYLCHLDNPEKAQYDPSQVKSFAGLDYHETIGLPIDRYNSIADMMEFCDEHNIFSFAHLLRIARDNRPDWFRILCDSGAFVMKEFLKSRSWETVDDARKDTK